MSCWCTAIRQSSLLYCDFKFCHCKERLKRTLCGTITQLIPTECDCQEGDSTPSLNLLEFLRRNRVSHRECPGKWSRCGLIRVRDEARAHCERFISRVNVNPSTRNNRHITRVLSCTCITIPLQNMFFFSKTHLKSTITTTWNKSIF